MSLSVASNISSLRAQNQLRLTTDKLSETFERLSSGLRINKASDDAGGLQMAEELRADARLATVAIRNVNDGLSATSMADSALGEVGNILTRMYELANQSSNNVYTNTQRSAMSLEFEALGSEVERISRVTTFNGSRLLSASNDMVIQVGLDGGANSRITVTAVTATLNALGIGAGSGALTYSLLGTTADASVSASRNALTGLDNAIKSLTSRRGTLGASQSRLSSALNYISLSRDNFIEAESRIRDADVASDVAEMVRLQVLQQATTAVLAQANQQPARVLRLLA
jgi:flagellin